MITFKKFLFEEKIEITEEEYFKNKDKVLENVVSKIKKDCQPWLKVAKENFYYRGINSLRNKSIFFTKLSVRQDRLPRDSHNELHKQWDMYFKEKFDFEYRSKSLFVSNKPLQASAYGKRYIVFPIGDIDYIFAPGLNDLLDGYAERFRNEMGQNPTSYIVNGYKLDFELTKKLMDQMGYIKNGDLPSNTGWSQEIMIKCNSYYALLFDMPNEIRNEMIKKLQELLK